MLRLGWWSGNRALYGAQLPRDMAGSYLHASFNTSTGGIVDTDVQLPAVGTALNTWPGERFHG